MTKDEFKKLRWVRDITLYSESCKVGIYTDDETTIAWFVGVEIARCLDYPEPAGRAIDAFKRAKESILDGLTTISSYETVTGKKETTFLAEDAVYLFLQRSDKPKAEIIQLNIARILREMRETGAAFRADLKEELGDLIASAEDLKDPLKRGLLIINQLKAIYEDQLSLRGDVKEIKDGWEKTTKKLAKVEEIVKEELQYIRPTLLHRLNTPIKEELVPFAKEKFEHSDQRAYGQFQGIIRDHFECGRMEWIPREGTKEAFELLYCIREATFNGLNLRRQIEPEEFEECLKKDDPKRKKWVQRKMNGRGSTPLDFFL